MANTHSLDLESGSSQYANIADGSQTNLDFSTDLTLEGWVKLESNGSQMHFINKYDSSASEEAYDFYVTSANKLEARFHDGTNRVVYTTDAAQLGSTGAWVHVAVTWDISEEACVFYVNGSAVASSLTNGTNIGANLQNSTSPFILGAGVDNTSTFQEFFDGKMDDWRAWNDVRSAAEILANYKKELIGNEDGLVGYWKCNDGSGTTLSDLTSNNNDLTLVASPSFNTDVPFTIGTSSLFYQQI